MDAEKKKSLQTFLAACNHRATVIASVRAEFAGAKASQAIDLLEECLTANIVLVQVQYFTNDAIKIGRNDDVFHAQVGDETIFAESDGQ